ncbi:MAG: N-acetylmuramoyl-L-alanine amidase [Bacteroidales bacterium]|nr:N-acetylmuramoyl-L-alanine amidase [Bacteroidales bacterium]
MANFKLALSAGHSNSTKRGCPKSLDPNQTNEWVLNNRIADKLEKLLAEYDGIEILRLDDTTGKIAVALDERSNAANKWGADFYLSIHHNGGINGGKGGGIVAYVYTNPCNESLEWQKELYNASIAATGLKGNRANPMPKSNLHEVREPNMPAVLMECGFMDSATDCPIILTEDFANKMANAFCEVIVKRSGATKKATESKPNKIYYVQVGAYTDIKNAEDMVKRLRAAGFISIIKTEDETIIEQETAEPEVESLKVGDKVKLTSNATIYGTTKKFSFWVYSSTLYVREIKGSRVVISTLKTGAITGATDKKYLTKI